jgi:protein-S-isoprenylcysteine O-methyltransferase Ste14
MRDRLGLAFFTFAATGAALLAWERPTLLAWLAVAHNALLAVAYARRKPAQAFDRVGLGLGILAAALPLGTPYPETIAWPILAAGTAGYGLVLWSVVALGPRFGIGPADRGLVTGGPYRFIRHPMYLGELLLRGALVAASPQPVFAAGMLLGLTIIQVLRIQREERVLGGYIDYASRVRFRLLPGVW